MVALIIKLVGFSANYHVDRWLIGPLLLNPIACGSSHVSVEFPLVLVRLTFASDGKAPCIFSNQ